MFQVSFPLRGDQSAGSIKVVTKVYLNVSLNGGPSTKDLDRSPPPKKPTRAFVVSLLLIETAPNFATSKAECILQFMSCNEPEVDDHLPSPSNGDMGGQAPNFNHKSQGAHPHFPMILRQTCVICTAQLGHFDHLSFFAHALSRPRKRSRPACLSLMISCFFMNFTA